MFRAGFIETWGRGYTKVRESFEADNYPMPVITEIDGGVSVWIKRFSLDELATRNKERYGDKAPNLQGTITSDVGIPPEKYPINAEKYPVNNESTPKKYPVNAEKYPVNVLEGKKLGKTALRIMEQIENNPKVTREQLALLVGISLDGVKKQVKSLRDMGIIVHEGSDKTGYWRIITNNNE